MSANKHTPGPWRVHSTVIGGEPVNRVDGPGRGKPVNWRPTRADAHLISAAPDMLEALELAIDEPNNLHGTECNQDPCTCWVGLARAAIKQARGEP